MTAVCSRPCARVTGMSEAISPTRAAKPSISRRNTSLRARERRLRRRSAARARWARRARRRAGTAAPTIAVITIAPISTMTDDSSGWVTCCSISSTFSTSRTTLRLHDRRADPRVVADRQALQAGGEGVAEVGAGVAHDGHEVARVEDVVRVVLQQQHRRRRASQTSTVDTSPPSATMSMIAAVTTGRNHSGISLQAKARIASGHAPGAPREQAQHRTRVGDARRR